MSTTATIIRCTDCRAVLRTERGRALGICDVCFDRATALAVIGPPSRHWRDQAREAAFGYDVEWELRQDADPDPPEDDEEDE